MAEEAAVDLGERQDAADHAVAFGDEVVRPMAEDILDDAAPADPMEERRLGAARDEFIPRGGVPRRVRPYCDSGRRACRVLSCCVCDDGFGIRHRAPFRNT